MKYELIQQTNKQRRWTYLEQMLRHIWFKIVEQCNLFVKPFGMIFDGVQMLCSIFFDVLQVLFIWSEQKTGSVIKKHTVRIIIELIAESVFVRVIHPFRHPENRTGRGVFGIFHAGEAIDFHAAHFAAGKQTADLQEQRMKNDDRFLKRNKWVGPKLKDVLTLWDLYEG